MSAGIGEALREAREARGLTLDDAAADTRIRATHLANIEREDFDALDSDVYTRGFIRNYAKAVGLDPEPLVQAFDELRGTGPARLAPATESEPALSAGAMDGGRRRGAGVIVAALALVGLIAIALWNGEGDEEPEAPIDDDLVADDLEDDEDDAPPEPDPEGPDADDEGPDEDEDAEGADDEPDEAEEPDDGGDEAAEAPDELTVQLTVTDGESWFQVLADEEELFRSVETAGWTETIEADETISMCLGNPAPVEITLHDEVYDDLGPPGQPTWVVITIDGVETERGCQV